MGSQLEKKESIFSTVTLMKRLSFYKDLESPNIAIHLEQSNNEWTVKDTKVKRVLFNKKATDIKSVIFIKCP
ncbi:hypothetical protein V7122_04120 [Bacillus sp. JJ1532]|uniref:hypothetical protein n=2 Tax=Bacillus TaxID=1386 RepID=UPI002FFF315E